MMRRLLLWASLLLLASPARAQTIFDYIKAGWSSLQRTHASLLEAAQDPKFGKRERWIVYVPPEDLDRVKTQLNSELKPEVLTHLELRPLDPRAQEPGLLYLPRPYVVPGGRFNEMYGWDSYFILLGLLRDGLVDQAADLVENQIYEVEHYGKVLNANRSYYLSRSQPPFLSRMVLELQARRPDRGLLERAYPALVKTYEFWTSAPHLTDTGLSRYYDLGEGPAPEVLAGETDASGKTHYQRIQDYFRQHPQVKDYDLSLYYDRAKDELTPLFYKGDRSMRESGFDPSNRFGPFNLDVIHYNPVELNTLLWVLEKDLAQLSRELGRDAAPWEKRMARRQELVNRYLWDPEQRLYLDYNFLTKARRDYPFATTFFPLWAGLASPEQAARVADNLKLLERPGGVVTSTYASGNQWDAPFGWAPLQLVAVQGLRRYHFEAPAERLSLAFLSLVLQEFRAHGTIVEKYDVEKRTSQVSSQIAYGYSSNEIGFGWTNAAYLLLYDALSPEGRRRLDGDRLP